MPTRGADELREAIWDVVCAIPRGRVATDGQVAELAGAPGAARHAGRCLAQLPHGSDVPWHRVVNAAGGISVSPERGGERTRQLRRLAAEGVLPRPSGRIDLRSHRWMPELALGTDEAGT